MAEGFYNKKQGGKFAISAGIVDASKKYNGHPRGDVIQVVEEVGINIRDQRVKRLTEEMLEMAEEIVVFCDKKICPEAVTRRTNVIYTEVDDPHDKDKTIDVVRTMRDKIKLIVENLQ